MFSETDEIAVSVVLPMIPLTWDKARALARHMMPDEGEQLRDDFAESLMRRSVAQWFTYQRQQRSQK